MCAGMPSLAPGSLMHHLETDTCLLFPLAWDLVDCSQGASWEHNRTGEGLALLRWLGKGSLQ